jgi:hypothetical protein
MPFFAVGLKEEHSMARAIYSHEAVDPDFQWLLSNYAERKGGVFTVDSTCLPVVMVLLTEEERARVGGVFQPAPPIPVQPPSEGAEHQSRDDTPNE